MPVTQRVPRRGAGAAPAQPGAALDAEAVRDEMDGIRDEVRRLRSELATLRRSLGGDAAVGSATGIATMAMAALGVLLGLFALFRH